MAGKSPTSQAIALRQMALGPTVDFDQALRMEYRIVIVDKDNRPQWSPPPSQAEVDAYFAPLGAGELLFPAPRS